MIYLIKSAAYNKDRGFHFILKIGYAKDIDDRMKAYLCHNPTYEFLASRNGTEEDEKKFHEYFKEFKYPELNEWFYYEQRIVNEFSTVDLESLPSKKYTESKRIELNLLKLIPDKSLLKDYYHPKGEPEEETLSKFYYRNRLWEEGLDYTKFYIHELSEHKELLSQYYALREDISARIKYICELDSSLIDTFLEQLGNNDCAKSYYTQIGKDKCRALGYRIDRIKKEIGIRNFNLDLLEKEIYTVFKVGSRIKKSDIKSVLRNIYLALGYNKTPKATDIENWFELKPTYFRENGKVINGFKLIKRKGT